MSSPVIDIVDVPTRCAYAIAHRANSVYPLSLSDVDDKGGHSSTNLGCSIMSREIMALTIGTQLGSHQITALLGKRPLHKSRLSD
jgi:hypothetical protein